MEYVSPQNPALISITFQPMTKLTLEKKGGTRCTWTYVLLLLLGCSLLLLLLFSVVAVQLAKVGSVDRVHSDLRRWHALAAPQGRDACAERYRL